MQFHGKSEEIQKIFSLSCSFATHFFFFLLEFPFLLDMVLKTLTLLQNGTKTLRLSNFFIKTLSYIHSYYSKIRTYFQFRNLDNTN